MGFNNSFKLALKIRRIEEVLLDQFSLGKINGTIHTCIGQEFVAIAFCQQLKSDDFVISNHRSHGHYIAFTNDVYGLVGELMGKEAGLCGGIGGSQHLHRGNFFSNGIQGGMVPVAAGMALAVKFSKNQERIVIAFIGDGTLGQGVLYETMNIVSKWEMPLLIVCENNFYAQSTPQKFGLAGDILKRADAFGLTSFESDSCDVERLFVNAQKSIDFVRSNCKPAFHLVNTYRLKAHSKGDDYRNKDEIQKYSSLDPLNKFSIHNPIEFDEYLREANNEIERVLNDLGIQEEMPIQNYWVQSNEKKDELHWEPLEKLEINMIQLINQFFDEYMAMDESILFIGEDVLDPYGGAFKAAQNLSRKYPNRVLSTPISEAAITGISSGLAMAGMRPYLEIMFGDFVTLIMDQLINHASKFHHMYNKQVYCPIVIRTPMGGRGGYGPTHSQTLDKFIVGIDNITVLALNQFLNPKDIYINIYKNEKHPTIVIENKADYRKKIAVTSIPNYVFERSIEKYPVIRGRPTISSPNATLVTYGGTAGILVDVIEDLFYEHEIKSELFVLTKISPIDCGPVIDSVKTTGRLFVVEDGSSSFGIGSEIIANVSQALSSKFLSMRIGAYPVPIPSAKSVEYEILPNKQRIIRTIIEAIS